MYWSHRNKWERFVFGHWVMICLSWEKQLFMGSFFTIALCSTLLGAHFSLKKMRQEGWAKYRSLLAFSLDSQLCRAAAFMSHQDTVTSHSQRQLDQDSTRVKFVSSVHTSCYYLFFSYLLKCELTVTLESLSTAQPVVRGSSWGVWGGFKCGGGDVDVGNRGESSKRVTEGGQECKQGMLGNQQVWSCFCVRIPPCSKDRL